MDDPSESLARQAVIDTRTAFHSAVRHALGAALTRRARRMVWVDPDFEHWPLDDAALLQSLADWLRLPQRQLLLLAVDFEGVRRQYPRFVASYRSWSHVIAAFSPAQDDAAELPNLLLVQDTMQVQLLDKAHWRGGTSTEPAALRLCCERVDALLQRAGPAFPVTTLGL